MDVREKLVELIAKAKRSMWGKSGLSCELARNMYLAENLIANGVTVQDNTEINDEFLKQLRNAPITILHEEPTIEVVQDVPDINVGNKWISVKEKLPNDREWVLVWHTGYSTPKKAKHKDDCDPYLPIFILDGDKGLGGEVTHWMPLPQPPKGE